MTIEPIVIGGIPVPDSRPVFLAVLGVHVLTGTVCVIAAFFRKRQGLHPRAGIVYYFSLVIVFVSLIALSVLRWPDTHLLIIGTITFTAATIGVWARRRRWRNWPRAHGTFMGVSYIGLLTGFYVDTVANTTHGNPCPRRKSSCGSRSVRWSTSKPVSAATPC